MCIHTQATTILLSYRNVKTSSAYSFSFRYEYTGGGGGGGGSCQYKPRLAQMFRNGKTANPNDAMLQLAQSILNIGFTLVKRWDRGK